MKDVPLVFDEILLRKVTQDAIDRVEMSTIGITSIDFLSSSVVKDLDRTETYFLSHHDGT